MHVEGISLRDRGPFRKTIETFEDTNIKRELILVLGNEVLQRELLWVDCILLVSAGTQFEHIIQQSTS